MLSTSINSVTTCRSKLQRNEFSDFDLGWYDYGARFYDASIGRWHVVDVLAGEYLNKSLYHFSGNNPIRFLDSNGMNYDDYFNEDGVFLGSDEAITDNVQIISQDKWDANKSVSEGGVESINHLVGEELSQNITSVDIGMFGDISCGALENIVSYYDSGLNDIIKNPETIISTKDYGEHVYMQSEIGGGFGIFKSPPSINVNVNGGSINKNLNTASNITNILVHEHKHQTGTTTSLSNSELRSIEAQKKHSSYSGVTDDYKKVVNAYEKYYKENK